MQGWHESGNQLLCARPKRGLSGPALPDETSQAPERSSPGRLMHACRGAGGDSVMVGVQAADNVLICQGLE